MRDEKLGNVKPEWKRDLMQMRGSGETRDVKDGCCKIGVEECERCLSGPSVRL